MPKDCMLPGPTNDGGLRLTWRINNVVVSR